MSKAAKVWAGCAKFDPPEDWQGGRNGVISPGYLAAAVWPTASYGNAFAYLGRRFGKPSPFDHHKQLCEYDLTTPDPEVGFYLACSPSNIGMRPGYWISPELSYAIMATERGITGGNAPPEGTLTRRACDAIEAGMRDLLRPVFIDDMAINILGKMADEDAAKLKPASRHAWKG